MQIIYVDADVYLNYLKWEEDRWRCLGELALMVFNRVSDGEFKLIISDHLLDEIKRHYDHDKVDEFIKKFEDKGMVIKVETTQEDIDRAKDISNHYTDPLHAILAEKENADYLVTRNVKDYVMPCPEMVNIVIPESLP